MPIYEIDGVSPELPSDGQYYIAPTAVLIGRVRLLKNASVWFGAVLRGDNDEIVIGENSNVQDNAVIHTDRGLSARLGNSVTVGHNAIIHSASVGSYSLIGMGATLLNGVSIGEACVVGAGALVPETRQYEDGALILGAPARMIRRLSGEEKDRLMLAANTYVEKATLYRSSLKRLD